MSNQISSSFWTGISLTIGYVILSLSIVIAYQNPAAEYELSIYHGTPVSFWVGISISLAVATVISFNSKRTILRLGALGLSGMIFTVLAALPSLRSYYYYGEWDSLGHLAYARDLISGVLSPFEMTYPALHTIAIFISQMTAQSIERSLLLVILCFVLTFFIFVPLVIRVFNNNILVITIGLFSSFLLLPINHVASFMHVFPASQAALYTAFVIYTISKYAISKNYKIVILWSISICTLVLLHPQQAANFLIFLVSISILQVMIRFLRSDEILDNIPTIHNIVGFLLIVFWIWSANLSGFEVSLRMLFSRLLIDDQLPGESVQNRGLSLEDLGTGLDELFVKIFLVSFFYCLIAGIQMLISTVYTFFGDNNKISSFSNHFNSDKDLNVIIAYFSFGFVSVSIIFIIYIIASLNDQGFRHLAFMMVIVTIVGAIGIGQFFRKFRHDIGYDCYFLVVLFLILFLVTIPIIFPSPYIYQSTGHVSKTMYEGYETAYEYQGPSLPYVYVRSNPGRYDFAINGREGHVTERGYIAPDHFNEQDLPAASNQTRYLTITQADRIRDPELYQGFRWSHDDFNYLERDSKIIHIQSNGEFDLYIVEGATNETDTRTTNLVYKYS